MCTNSSLLVRVGDTECIFRGDGALYVAAQRGSGCRLLRPFPNLVGACRIIVLYGSIPILLAVDLHQNKWLIQAI